MNAHFTQIEGPDHRQFKQTPFQRAEATFTLSQRMAAVIAAAAPVPGISQLSAQYCRRQQRLLRWAAYAVLKQQGRSNGWIGLRFGKDTTTVRDGIKAIARDLANDCPESREALARMEALLCAS